MFWYFLNVHKQVQSMKKKKRATTINPPPLATVKDSMFIGKGGIGGRGRRDRSCLQLGERRRKREPEKKEEEKIEKSHTASSQKSCNFFKIVSVLLPALVERFNVSHMQDFKNKLQPDIKKHPVYFQEYLATPIQHRSLQK